MGYNLKATKKTFDPVEDNRYKLKVEATKIEPHEKNGTEGEKIEVTYKIMDGEFANRKVWDNIYLPWTAWKARTILEAGGSDMAAAEDVTAEGIANALIGLEVSAYIETSKTEGGSIRTNVKEYRPVDGDIPGILQ